MHHVMDRDKSREFPFAASPIERRPLAGALKGPMRYGLAVGSVAVVLLLKFAIRPFFQDDPPFLLLSGAVMLSAWAGGLGPGLLATFLGTMLASYFFMVPIHTFVAFQWRQDLPLLGFLLEGAFISWLAERLRSLWQRSEESREQFRLLVDGTVDYALILMDPTGNVRSWNTGAQRITGHRAEEIIGRHFSCFFEPADIALGKPEEELRLAITEQRFEVEGWGIRKDGTRYWANVVTTALRDKHAELCGFARVTRDDSARRKVAQALAESESRLRAVLETAADAIVVVDAHGVIQSVNPATERVFGYPASELVDRHVGILMPSPYREEHDSYIQRYLATGQKRIIGVGREAQGLRKDGSVFPLELAVSEIDHLRLFTGILRDVSRRKELEREVTEIAALEQQRIGQELHDSVGQELTGLALMADALSQQLEEQSPGLGRLAMRITAGVGRVHDQVRALSRGLVPVEFDAEGLRAALQDFATRISEQAGINCAFHCREPVLVTDTLVATHLFRITQEAVSNSLRHGHAHHIDIGLQARPEALELTVRDDGLGIPATATENGGVGIRIMRNRAAMIGGTISIAAANDGGTMLRCMVPRNGDGGDKA